MVVHFENLDGVVLVPSTLRGVARRDTSGPLALDTGAGYLALDLTVARLLGVADSTATSHAVDLAARPLPRFVLGGWSIDQVEPVLTVDAEVVRRVTDRPVLGLLGQQPIARRVLWIDYRHEIAAFVPAADSVDLNNLVIVQQLTDSSAAGAADDPAVAASGRLLTGALSPRAVAVRFRLVGDGKILIHGRLSDPRPPRWGARLNLLVDTGATKCVLFADAIDLGRQVRRGGRWQVLRGLSAPTLIGAAEASLARIPAIQIEASGRVLQVDGVDAGLIESGLSEMLSRATRETIHGLIGYSLLKRFRVAVDYPHRVLWLDPIPGWREDRPLEYCHVGLQLERRDGAVRVTGVAEGSPAARAGIAGGDELVALDGMPVGDLDLAAIARGMEGRPGTPLTLTLRKGAVERTYRLVRRRLL